MQNTSLKVRKPETPVLHIKTATFFDIIFSSIQLSQDFKVSNDGPFNRKFQLNKQVSFLAHISFNQRWLEPVSQLLRDLYISRVVPTTLYHITATLWYHIIG